MHKNSQTIANTSNILHRRPLSNLFYEIVDRYLHSCPHTQFFVLYAPSSEFSTHIKFKVLHDVLSNIFVKSSVKEVLFDIFSKSQRNYYAFSRLARKFQYYKAPVRVDFDLYMNHIAPEHPKTIIIYDPPTRSKYMFTCMDLIHIIQSSLMHNRCFMIDPLPCKNPYTNMPFQRSALYTIYFHIQRVYPVIPLFLHTFFIANFEIAIFVANNSQYIRNTIVKNYLKLSTTNTLYIEVLHMLHIVNSKFFIHHHFPEDTLVDIMRPYLYLYFMFIYAINDSETKGMYFVILKQKMNDFYRYNPRFGRKISTGRIVTYRDNSPYFTMSHINEIIAKKEYEQWYLNMWTIPTRYRAQLSRHRGYAPPLFHTDIDDDYESSYDDYVPYTEYSDDSRGISIGSNTVNNHIANADDSSGDNNSHSSDNTIHENNDIDGDANANANANANAIVNEEYIDANHGSGMNAGNCVNHEDLEESDEDDNNTEQNSLYEDSDEDAN